MSMELNDSVLIATKKTCPEKLERTDFPIWSKPGKRFIKTYFLKYYARSLKHFVTNRNLFRKIHYNPF